MRASATKTMASPGRPEKLPGPALKSGSRSGRSRGPMVRSSPMFASGRRRPGASGAASETEVDEPSSPKVTCIGQVRIRKKNKKKKKANHKVDEKPRCKCLERVLLCGRFSCKPKRVRAWWRMWALPLGSSYRRASKKETQPVPPPVVSDDEEEEEGERKVFVPSGTATPPKNALLLMRCRSAPHNQAALLAARPSSSPEQGRREGIGEEDDGAMSNGSSRNESSKEEKEEKKTALSSSAAHHPPMLMRCKSEPARKAAKLGASGTQSKLETTDGNNSGLHFHR